jgi:hypothetical protein
MPFRALFDRVYVISLPSSTDRRDHIRAHFQQIGLHTYEFHDACGIHDPEVAQLYAEGRVAQYPPCFRCGKAECGKPDCNNVLIPQQVAVFASYLRLWRKLAKLDERVLICEDDVLFHTWWASVLQQVAAKITAGDLIFEGSSPTLLRFGWALGSDHDARLPFGIDNRIRMSNPCHAITSAYARALLETFDGVRHTADVFQHQIAPVSQSHAHTVFPAIASELSWSAGTLTSLIHPKEVHARYLEQHGREAEAVEYRKRISAHIRDIAHKTPS